MTREKRFITHRAGIEQRAEAARPTLVGYAAVFNSPAMIGDFFEERIAPGAFSAAIGRDDVRALINHDDELILGRTKSGTLRLSEDATGLLCEIDPPDTSYANDLIESMRRGDIDQMSFGFRATKEQWDETGPVLKRTILEVELFDVSPVTFPAYESTEIALRSAQGIAPARRIPNAELARRETDLRFRIRLAELRLSRSGNPAA